MGTESRLGVLVGHVDLNLTSTLKTKKVENKYPRYILVENGRPRRCPLWRYLGCTGCGICTASPTLETAPPGSHAETWWRSAPPQENAHTNDPIPEDADTHGHILIAMYDSSLRKGRTSSTPPKHRMSPVSSRWGGACERWWLYWMSWTVASLTALCKGSQLLNKGVKRGTMQGWKEVTSSPSRRRLTLLFRHSPHHDVHTGSVGLAAQFQGAQFALEVLHIV